jgi:ribosomal protein S18 acetylase RimI-like enzyme
VVQRSAGWPLETVVPRLRSGQAADAGEACPLVRSAGPELLDYAFSPRGQDCLEFLRYCFIRGRSLLGYPLCTVADADGWVVGTVSVYSADEYWAYHRQFVWEVIRFFGLRQGRTVLRRMRHLGSVLPAIDRDAAYLSSLAVDPRWQRRGIGARLVEWAIERSRSAGFTVLTLDVSTVRPEAQRLYERAGFMVVAQHTFSGDLPGEPIPDYRRMQLRIGEE